MMLKTGKMMMMLVCGWNNLLYACHRFKLRIMTITPPASSMRNKSIPYIIVVQNLMESTPTPTHTKHSVPWLGQRFLERISFVQIKQFSCSSWTGHNFDRPSSVACSVLGRPFASLEAQVTRLVLGGKQLQIGDGSQPWNYGFSITQHPQYRGRIARERHREWVH